MYQTTRRGRNRSNVIDSDDETESLPEVNKPSNSRRNNLGDDDILKLLDNDTEEEPRKRTRTKKPSQPEKTVVKRRGRPRKN